jgi:hypothetical protein
VGKVNCWVRQIAGVIKGCGMGGVWLSGVHDG